MRAPAILVAASFALGAVACADPPRAQPEGGAPAAASGPVTPAVASTPAGAPAADAVGGADAGPAADAGAGGAPSPGDADPMALHKDTREALMALFSWKPPTARERARMDRDAFLEKTFGVGTPSRVNQGNKAIARHLASKAQCLEGLRGVVLQTEEQRERCEGAPNMVPIYKNGRLGSAKVCMDLFEFPNLPCELPVVWAAPTQAAAVCELQGKRLCTQEEWVLACRGDPGGGEPTAYAYGDALDLEVCNTAKRHRAVDGTDCDADSAASAWKTCATDTEPSGAFPRCRSRFGVFDQHGNVAEIMTRLDADGTVYGQLKGSAFFYAEVARERNARPPEGRETYPDHCAHDPRWHVEPMASAWHVNYHLGFRCCKTIR